MNLKELGSLLVLLYLGSCLLVAYKYYRSKGLVFEVSKFVLLKYVLRFCVLISLLFLAFYSINQHNTRFTSESQKQKIVFVISKNSSISTWNAMQQYASEVNQEGLFSLVESKAELKSLELLIPFTNQEAFLNLLSHSLDDQHQSSKLAIPVVLTSYPQADKFQPYVVVGDKWIASSNVENKSTFFSFELTNTWFRISFLRVYLVILAVLLLSVDLIFTIKAIKK